MHYHCNLTPPVLSDDNDSEAPPYGAAHGVPIHTEWAVRQQIRPHQNTPDDNVQGALRSLVYTAGLTFLRTLCYRVFLKE